MTIDINRNQGKCCFCKNAGSLKEAGLNICTPCLEGFKKKFDDPSDHSKTLQPMCSFCASVLPVPGTPLLSVIKQKLSKFSICEHCVDVITDRIVDNRTAKILQFPKPKG